MNRILGIFAFSSVLLSACGGGGVQSPDFQPTLVGFVISSPAEVVPNTSTPLTVVPSGTLQLTARGLFSTPPGTQGAGTTPCAIPPSTVNNGVCTLGSVSGVTFSIDPPVGTNRTFATVSESGVVTGVRRGEATIRGRLTGFEEIKRKVVIDGPVLKAFTITALDVKNNLSLTARPASVPVGRSIALTGVATCQSGYGSSEAVATCTNQNYQFNWNLPVAAPADTAVFTPSPAVGETIAVKTQRFGPFGVEASLTNEEGDVVEATIDLAATTRVLDDIVVVADTAQPEPISIIKGTRVRFTAKGVFSDGATDDLIEADLSTSRPPSGSSSTTYRAGRRLTWRQDSSFVGGPIFIEDPADSDGDGVIDPNEQGIFNNSVIVTVVESQSSPAVIGPNGLNAAGFNLEQIPVSPGSSTTAPLLVEDRAAISIEDLGLTAVTRICLDTDLASQCTENTQVQQNGDPVKYVARGTFVGDPAGSERNIDPRLIPIQFIASTATANLIAVNVDADRDGQDGNSNTPDPDTSIDFDDVGTVRGVTQGLARLIATLPSGFATTIADRDAQVDIAVTEQSCRDQFLVSNGTTGAATTSDTIGISDARDAGNVIDGVPATSGSLTIGPSVLGGSVSMTFQRTGSPMLLGGGQQNVGFTLRDVDGYVANDTATIRTLNAEGGTVETFTSGLTVLSNGSTGDAQRTLVFGRATLPYTGVTLTLDVPLLLGIPGTLTPDELTGLTLLTGYDIRVFSACANVVQP